MRKSNSQLRLGYTLNKYRYKICFKSLPFETLTVKYVHTYTSRMDYLTGVWIVYIHFAFFFLSFELHSEVV